MTTHFSRFVITADTHPDHDTICTFRRENRPRLSERFMKVLQMAQTVKVLKFGQITVSADGTKVLANASKHAAVEVESRLIVGQRVSLTPNDKQERVPTVAAIPAEAGSVAAGPLDSRWGRLHPRASGELWEHSRLERRTR